MLQDTHLLEQVLAGRINPNVVVVNDLISYVMKDGDYVFTYKDKGVDKTVVMTRNPNNGGIGFIPKIEEICADCGQGYNFRELVDYMTENHHFVYDCGCKGQKSVARKTIPREIYETIKKEQKKRAR